MLGSRLIWLNGRHVFVMIKFNMNSPQHVSALFYGGEFKIIIKKEMIGADGNPLLVKTGDNKGKPRVQNVEEKIKIKGFGCKGGKKTKKESVFQVNEKILSYIANEHYRNQALIRQDYGVNMASNVAKLILEIRSIEKQLSTYYDDKYICEDSCLHPNFQLTSTDTGRSSCATPNIQNIPKGSKNNIKCHFTSRNGGKYVKCDLKQIEVVCFAETSQDEVLIGELNNGIDIHTKNAQEIFNLEQVPDKIRQSVKAATFGMIYGSGAKKLALTTGNNVDWCQQFINRFFNKYQEAKYWQDKIVKQINNGQLISHYRTLTGRILTFKQKDAPDFLKQRGIIKAYNPPDIKNYPIQSVAADLAMIMMGKFWRERALYNRNNYLMVNFVHDEIDFDCINLELLKKDIKIVETWPDVCYSMFKYRWRTQIRIDVTNGNSWGDCK